MSKNKSFFQKLSESFINLFPFNSTSKYLSNDSFDTNLSQNKLISNRRMASEAFGKINDNEFKTKRAKLSHDPMSFPTSRIIKPQNLNNEKFINFNDGASDYSESSSISVSTSGVSSLHPRTNRRIHFGDGGEIPTNMKYSRNLNLSFNQNEDLMSPFSSIKPVKNNTLNNFMSSPAKKILEKLDKLTTPITACDRLTNLLAPDPLLSIKRPYSKPFQGPPKYSKKPCPMKAVTVSVSSSITNKNCTSVPHKPTWSKRKRPLGYFDTDIDNDIDLNSETITGFTNSSTQINLLNVSPKKSQATDTDDFCFQHINGAELSPVLKFTFRPPNSFEDEFYGSTTNNEKRVSNSVYKFKSIITDEEIKQYDRRFICQDSIYKNKSALLWRCDTCFMENVDDILECTNCGNLSKKNKDKVIISQSAIKSALRDEKMDIVKKVLENDKHSTVVANKVMGTVPVLALTLTERSNIASDENSNFINLSNAESRPTISSVVSCNIKAMESNNKIDFSTNSNMVNSQGKIESKINCDINENIVNQTSESKEGFTFGKSNPIASDSKTESTISQSKTDSQFSKLFKFGECSNSDSSAISTPLSINAASNVISTPFSFKPVFKEQTGNVENDIASSKALTVPTTKEVLSINSSCPFNMFSASNATIKLTESQKLSNTTTETPFSFGCRQNNTLPLTAMNFGLSSSVITSPLATSIPSFGAGPSSVMSPLTSFNSISTANSSASCFQFGGSENIASNFGSNVGLSSGFNFPISSTRFQFGQSSNADGNINPSGAGVPFQFNSGGGNVSNSNEIGTGIVGNHGIVGCNTRRLLKPRRKR